MSLLSAVRLPAVFAQTGSHLSEKVQPVKQAGAAHPFHPEIELVWKNGTRLKARLQSLQKDSLYVKIVNRTSTTLRAVSLKGLTDINLVCHGNFGKVVAIALLGGGVGVLIGLASGDDKPGWFSLTAQEKAILLGGTISLGTIFWGGSVEAIRAADVEIPLDTMSILKRQRLIRNILAKKYRTPHPFYVQAAANYLRYKDGRSAPGYLLSIHLQLKPSIWVGISHGAVSWNDWHQNYSYSDPYETYVNKGQHRLFYLNLTLKKLFLLKYPVVPYVEWGVLYGLRLYKTHTKDVTYGPYANTREYGTYEKGLQIGVPLSAGAVVPLTKPLALDLRVANIFSEEMGWQFQLGLQYKLWLFP